MVGSGVRAPPPDLPGTPLAAARNPTGQRAYDSSECVSSSAKWGRRFLPRRCGRRLPGGPQGAQRVWRADSAPRTGADVPL